MAAEGGALGTEGGDALLDSSGQLNLKSEEVVRRAFLELDVAGEMA